MENKTDDQPNFSSNGKNAAAKSEIQEYLSVRKQRRWIFPRAALVGAGAGTVALLFRAALTGADVLRNGLITWAHNLPILGWIFPVLFTLLGAGISVAITRRYAPEASGSGIPHLEAVLHRLAKAGMETRFAGQILWRHHRDWKWIGFGARRSNRSDGRRDWRRHIPLAKSIGTGTTHT